MRWCSGTLIKADLFLTAAHCFRVSNDPSGWITPRKGQTFVSPAGLAPLMHLNFNFQVNPANGQVRTAETFPITELVEFGDERPSVAGAKLDYAVVRVGRNAANKLPGDLFTVANFDASPAAQTGATQLTIIQHPQGRPKRIEAGADIREPRDVLIRYGDLDTLGGSSGAGIIDQQGRLIGVHTNGGCTAFSGFNFGFSLNAIAQVSGEI